MTESSSSSDKIFEGLSVIDASVTDKPSDFLLSLQLGSTLASVETTMAELPSSEPKSLPLIDLNLSLSSPFDHLEQAPIETPIEPPPFSSTPDTPATSIPKNPTTEVTTAQCFSTLRKSRMLSEIEETHVSYENATVCENDEDSEDNRPLSWGIQRS